MLSNLCAELKNSIFEFSFAPDHPGEVDLLTARHPTIDLLLTNKAIYSAAKGIYTAARKAYWRDTHFTINRSDDAAKTELARIPDNDLEQISQLNMSIICSNNLRRGRSEDNLPIATVTMLSLDGWEATCLDRKYGIAVIWGTNGGVQVFIERVYQHQETWSVVRRMLIRKKALRQEAVPVKRQIKALWVYL